jgi:hypothetical protein
MTYQSARQPIAIYRVKWLNGIRNIVVPGLVPLAVYALVPDAAARAVLATGVALVVLFLAYQSYASCLKLYDDGLEYRYWPYYHVRCQWADVESFHTRSPFGFRQHALYLKRATVLGNDRGMQARRRIVADGRYLIPLTSLAGWPRGDLARQLRRRLPHLIPGDLGE